MPTDFLQKVRQYDYFMSPEFLTLRNHLQTFVIFILIKGIDVFYCVSIVITLCKVISGPGNIVSAVLTPDRGLWVCQRVFKSE